MLLFPISIKKRVIQDHLSAYPLVADSIRHFYDPDLGFLSIAVDTNTTLENVVKELMYYVENGAFKLFEKYQALKDILVAVDSHDNNFSSFKKFLDLRNAIRVATIRYIVVGKENAISWFEKLEVSDGDFNRREILEKMNF